MKLQPVIARLKAQTTLLGGNIAGAAEFAEAREQEDLPLPHAFVLPDEDEVLPAQTAGRVQQVLEEAVAIVVGVDNTDRRGQAASEALDDIRAELLAALVGWEPAAGLSGLEYAGAGIEDINRAAVWRRFVFSTRSVIEQI